MQRYFWVLIAALVGGCGLPPAVMIASYAADGVSYVATGKSVSDHGISEVTGRDCAVWRIVEGESICKDTPTQRANPAPVEMGQQATLPPGDVARKAAAGRHHYLVLGSFADLHNAERLAAGHDDRHVAPATIDGRLIHRVIAGPLSDREVARLQQQLAHQDQPRAWEIAALPPGF
jgi:sporulation related protein